MNPSASPPFWARLLAGALRRAPVFRGRWRVEQWLDRRVAGRQWQSLLSVNGCRMELALNDEIDRQIFLNGVYERTATAAIKRLPLRGATVVDGGANIGYHTLLFARCVGGEGRVHAIEAAPANARRLARNLALNTALAARVTTWPVALSDSAGEAEMAVAGASHSGTSHIVPASPVADATRQRAGEAGRIRVPCRTLDQLWREMRQPPIGLVKLDLEGFEARAIEGGRELLSGGTAPVVLVEVIDTFLRSNGSSRQALFESMKALGYQCHDFDPAARRFIVNDTPRDATLAIFSKTPLSGG